MSKNILITGANGQLGNEMRLLGTNSSDNYIYTDIAELDITNLDDIRSIVSAKKVDIIVNCAAYTNVDKAEDDIETAELINNRAVENLALAAKEFGAVLIHISTDYVFNGEGCIPLTENLPIDPLGVYGRTKSDGEKSIEATNCHYIIIRTSWLYSEFGGNFVKTMLHLTAERDLLNVVFDQVGTPTYARDLAGVVVNIVENDKYIGNNGVYHYSNEGVCSWYDFAHEIADLGGNSCDIQPCHSDQFPSKVKRPHYSVLDKTKIKQTFELSIPYWKESLKICIQNLKKQK